MQTSQLSSSTYIRIGIVFALVLLSMLFLGIQLLQQSNKENKTNPAESVALLTPSEMPAYFRLTPTIAIRLIPSTTGIQQQSKPYITAQNEIYQTNLKPTLQALELSQDKEYKLKTDLPYDSTNFSIWFDVTDRKFIIQLIDGKQEIAITEVNTFLQKYSYNSYNELSNFKVQIVSP